jgi:hypothetical protein
MTLKTQTTNEESDKLYFIKIKKIAWNNTSKKVKSHAWNGRKCMKIMTDESLVM